MNEKQATTEEIQNCISVLESFVNNREAMQNIPEAKKIALLKAAGQLTRPSRAEVKELNKTWKQSKKIKKRAIEKNSRARTGIREARTATVFSAPLQLGTSSTQATNNEAETVVSARNCYICKAEFTKLHFFYDSMCASCAQFNYEKRFQSTSLDGQVALITGSRLKIGYHATLMLLRAGARVIATTRFPVDSASRFSQEKDFAKWKDRLHIYGLDLRHTPSVEIFALYIKNTYDRLDILINNAAQTVRRPPGFYAHLIDNEKKLRHELPPAVQELLHMHEQCKEQLNLLNGHGSSNTSALPVAWHVSTPGIGIQESAQLSQIPYSYDNSMTPEEVFPAGKLDADLQQVDLRKTNSWRLKLGEIPTPEMLEVQLVNAVAPFVLCNRLVSLMRQDNTGKKHIVNVSAMEGKFHRFKKQDRHPHTNMAKAALNMLTHTSASDFAKDGIYMNAVDTGWVTDEDPVELSQKKQDLHDFQPPLDIVDGAARVCDPFFDGIITGKHWCGKFLKDYKPIDW